MVRRKIENVAWQRERNQTASKVIWKFSTEDARVKLKHRFRHSKVAEDTLFFEIGLKLTEDCSEELLLLGNFSSL